MGDQTCPKCGHPHLPMPGPWTTDAGHRVNPECGWPMGDGTGCDCHRRTTGGAALASQRSDGLGRSERAEGRRAPDSFDAAWAEAERRIAELEDEIAVLKGERSMFDSKPGRRLRAVHS